MREGVKDLDLFLGAVQLARESFEGQAGQLFSKGGWSVSSEDIGGIVIDLSNISVYRPRVCGINLYLLSSSIQYRTRMLYTRTVPTSTVKNSRICRWSTRRFKQKLY
jgi:hypothetical protein